MMHRLFIQNPHSSTLKNVNVRKEVHGEDDMNALDMKMIMILDESMVQQVFVEPESAQKSLWAETGDVRDADIALAINSVAKDQRVTLVSSMYEDMVFAPASVKLQKAVPEAGKTLELTLTVSVYPKVEEIGPIADLAGEAVRITVIPHQSDIDDVEPFSTTEDSDYDDEPEVTDTTDQAAIS